MLSRDLILHMVEWEKERWKPYRFIQENSFLYGVSKVDEENEKVSSTRIRQYSKGWKNGYASTTLRQVLYKSGIVIHGDKRGRTIGFPTANIELNDEYILPPHRCLCSQNEGRCAWYNGVCNVGFKPTFNKEAEQSYLLKFIYLILIGTFMEKK